MESLVEWLEIKQRIANRDAAFGVMPDRRYGQAATAITTLEAMCETLAGAFLETREMLGLAEQIVCEECCPTTWKTADGRPHCKLHQDILAVLFKHEATRDQALTEWRDQHHGGNDADT